MLHFCVTYLKNSQIEWKKDIFKAQRWCIEMKLIVVVVSACVCFLLQYFLFCSSVCVNVFTIFFTQLLAQTAERMLICFCMFWRRYPCGCFCACLLLGWIIGVSTPFVDTRLGSSVYTAMGVVLSSLIVRQIVNDFPPVWPFSPISPPHVPSDSDSGRVTFAVLAWSARLSFP